MQVCQNADVRGLLSAGEDLWASGGAVVSQHIGMLEAQNMHLHHRAQLLELILASALREKEESSCRTRPVVETAAAWPQPPVLLGRHTLAAGRKPSADFRPPPGLSAPSPKFVRAAGLASMGAVPASLADQALPLPKFIRTASFPASEAAVEMMQHADPASPVLVQSSCIDAARAGEAGTAAADILKPCLDLIHQSSNRCTVAWRIESVGSKLRTSRGFPLLSPSFTLAGLPELRLMFAPGDEWLELAGTGMSRRQKQRRTKAGPSSEAQTFGMVKVKAGDADACSGVHFHVDVFMGETRSAAAPSTSCDFSKEVVQSCPLEVDWRKHMEGSCLTMMLDFSW